jgi:hypothetical protein
MKDPYMGDFFDFISVLKSLKTADLGLKHTIPITSYQSVATGKEISILTITFCITLQRSVCRNQKLMISLVTRI